ncbi:peptidoglycan-binding domain-containing protein [Egbenema bharatensis]|uniref:peptidoglycan-binding domain-containing protein n=1 Tax=Egbenema bharatensis TaxID=3463334 RepID=UPI003A871DCF
METLAYLHLAQENENPEVKELTVDAGKLAGKTAIGAIGIAAAAVGAFGMADQASASYYGGCGSYDPCSGGGYDYYSYHDPCYDPCSSGYSHQSYSYDYYSYHDPCYDPCSGGGYDYYSYHDPCYDPCHSSGHDYYSYQPSHYPSHDPCYDPCGGYQPVSPIGGVHEIQIALNKAGFHVYVDGVYGPQTAHAVKAFQASRGLLVDGIVGPQTISALQHYLY